MKNILKKTWELIKIGLMLLGALVVIHVTILLIHNATNEPTPPPSGWKPLLGDDNYEEYLQKLEDKQKHGEEGSQKELN
ncbi:MAG: hypothetical protein MK052_06350 [Alphaproteobacteria bacterium]|nr:hypothetical protein [Alphaproteobacteria bacterium]